MKQELLLLPPVLMFFATHFYLLWQGYKACKKHKKNKKQEQK